MFGAVGCAEWAGARFADILDRAGPQSDARFLEVSSLDDSPEGGAGSGLLPETLRLFRVSDLVDAGAILAVSMNGEAVPAEHGGPFRLIIPGYSAGHSRKWVKRLTLRASGAGVAPRGFRLPRRPLRPGEAPDANAYNVAGQTPVKSLITWPLNGAVVSGDKLAVRGRAWGGGPEGPTRLHLSFDYGATWFDAPLGVSDGPYAWRSFSYETTLPSPGYFEVWGRAFDARGVGQPFKPAWNNDGIYNNMAHRIAIYRNPR